MIRLTKITNFRHTQIKNERNFESFSLVDLLKLCKSEWFISILEYLAEYSNSILFPTMEGQRTFSPPPSTPTVSLSHTHTVPSRHCRLLREKCRTRQKKPKAKNKFIKHYSHSKPAILKNTRKTPLIILPFKLPPTHCLFCFLLTLFFPHV